MKILHSLDRTVWDGKVKAILESEKYDTQVVNKLFSKLKSAEMDCGMTARQESSTDSHSLVLVGGKGAKSNANASSRMYSLSSLMTLPYEEFDVLGEDKLALLTRRFERLHENWVNTRKNPQTCFQCDKPGHFIVECPEKMESKDVYRHRSSKDNKYQSQAQEQAQGRVMVEEEGGSRQEGPSDVDSSSAYSSSSSSSSEDEGDGARTTSHPRT
jgi:hypothetical protein